MMTPRWLQQSLAIARAERRRYRREFGRQGIGPGIVRGVLLIVTVVSGMLAYSAGRDLASERAMPLEALWILVVVVFGWLVWRSATLTHMRFERLAPDMLLTTVPTRAAATGVLLFVYARVVAVIALPTVGVGVGAAFGLRSPAVAVTIVAATVGVTALAVAVGVAARLAVYLVGTRLTRGGLYRDLLVVFGWVPLLAGWLLLQEASLSVAPLRSALESQPLAWFVDLALLGAGDLPAIETHRGLGALGLVVLAVPPAVAVTVAVARRIWESEPASSSGSHGSRTLTADGWLDRLLGDYVSRPVRTIARERWLMERRVPRGLLSTGYVLLFAALVLLPTFSIAGGPNGLLLFLTISLGLAAGIAFGTDPFGIEYRSLPMLLTTVGGRQFVGGYLLAALSVGVVVVTAVVFPLGLVAPVGIAETILLVLVGIAICAATASVGVAIGTGVERNEFVPAPFFFTDVPVYTEMGLVPFLRLGGGVFAIVSIVGLPAFLGNSPPVYERLAVLGLSTGAVRLGALFATILVAAGVSKAASRIAIERYRRYRIRRG
ncbi:hypothetical protein C496_15502 [Natronorubrum tibetense GA33]|uniref:Uncharacterized protein n=2 Tax=Natronorubrum tibetense TaxID=63128 RepID=L9VQE1_9EURY|nr:hypothetical protein C496_15502 [Natronorubrum tibetense GA33]